MIAGLRKEENKMKKINSLYEHLAIELRKPLYNWLSYDEPLQEIRLRIGQPLMVRYGGEEIFLTTEGEKSHEGGGHTEFIVTEAMVNETLSYLSDYSLYAYEEEIKQGFFTIKGGCRIGVCGKTVMEHGKVHTIYPISSLNIRFAHEVKGCSTPILPMIVEQERLYSTLFLSPPMCGKTTILRDLIRQISNGFQLENEKTNHLSKGSCLLEGKTVGVVDERGEIGDCYLGVLQHDLGRRTDVLSNCPKVEGMMMLIRTMAPEVIAVDEIGSEEEMYTMMYGMKCGCTMLATAHSATIEELQTKRAFQKAMEEQLFQRYVLLSRRKGIGTVEAVYDEKGSCMWKCS